MVKRRQELTPKPIPAGHEAMLKVLTKIPDTKIETRLTPQQQIDWDTHRVKWIWTMKRIDHLQMCQLGYLPGDPFDSVNWAHQKMRVMLSTHADFYFSILQILIRGFDCIGEAAVREGLDFWFDDPRELFSQICREDANYGIAHIFDSNDDRTLSRTRTALSHESALFRGRLSGTEEERTALLALQSAGWSGFWLYAIWGNRFKKELIRDWQDFLENHKALCSFMSKKNFKAEAPQIVLPRWERGVPYLPKSGGLLDIEL